MTTNMDSRYRAVWTKEEDDYVWNLWKTAKQDATKKGRGMAFYWYEGVGEKIGRTDQACAVRANKLWRIRKVEKAEGYQAPAPTEVAPAAIPEEITATIDGQMSINEWAADERFKEIQESFVMLREGILFISRRIDHLAEAQDAVRNHLVELLQQITPTEE